ncbi:hypothetical protein [Marinilactibacillus kalidii]|uniref:hypothetical protein n=1 Tax=Marinilactibacillus kalidii TaxID=2820274 RepID=UPI001ABEE5C8|nr:hypothetical protein [Marinilactibacillus kalidii]
MDSNSEDRTVDKAIFFTYLCLTILTLGTLIERVIKGRLAIEELPGSLLTIMSILLIFKTVISYKKWRMKKGE